MGGRQFHAKSILTAILSTILNNIAKHSSVHYLLKDFTKIRENRNWSIVVPTNIFTGLKNRNYL